MKATIIVREKNRKKPDYSLEFDLPEIPRINEYISIQRPDENEPLGEDLIVVDIWWRLSHPETGITTSDNVKIGTFTELMIECDPVLGPYSSIKWRAANKNVTRMPFNRWSPIDNE